MDAPHALPIIFAVTGHRDIRPEDEPALSSAVWGIFERFRLRYPTTPLILLTPLAGGADRLVARVAISAGVAIRVTMPLPEPEYRKDFDTAQNTVFSELLATAEAVESVPYVGTNDDANVGEPNRRRRQYAAVGAHIVGIAHVLVALWNGKAASTAGGTAEVVQFRLYGIPEEFHKGMLLDAPATGAVYQVATARRSDPDTETPVGSLTVRTRDGIIANGVDPSTPLYEKFERFNSDRASLRRKKPALIEELPLKELSELLATQYQRRYRVALDIIFGSTTVAAIGLAVAHSDSPRYAWALLYVLLLAIASATYLIADTSRWKDRAIEYRSLEIGLSLQHVWDLIGLRKSVPDFYLRIQRSEFEWIREAMRTARNLADKTVSDQRAGVTAVSDFVSSQREFFAKALARDRRQCDRYEYATNAFVGIGSILSVALFVLAIWSFGSFAIPIGLGQWTSGTLRAFTDHGDAVIRGIVIATILAAVAHEYPKRRAFHAQARRYAIMLNLYQRAHELLCSVQEARFEERLQVAREVISEVGQEALAENGEWLMMHRELPIETVHV